MGRAFLPIAVLTVIPQEVHNKVIIENIRQ